MMSAQDGITAAFAILNLFLLYYILVEIYIHLILMLVIYLGYKYIQLIVDENIDLKEKSVLITGCDTGFGHDLALKLETLGCTVYAGCLLPKGDGAKKLNAKNSDRMHVLHLDVTNDNHVSEAVQYVKKHSRNQGLWGVVNNAGIERGLDIELVPMEQMKRIAEVNFYGMVRVTKAFIPMVRQTKGRIVNVTSVKGRLALPRNVSYVVTNYAGEAFSDILRREMQRFDVKVSIIEPGNFGGATAILNKQDCDNMERELKDVWKTIPSDVQAMYGWEYINAQIQGSRLAGAGGYHSTVPVTDAMVDALVSTNPKCRYLIAGGEKWIDIWAVLPVLSGYLPESVMDWIIANLHPPPKLAAEYKS